MFQSAKFLWFFLSKKDNWCTVLVRCQGGEQKMIDRILIISLILLAWLAQIYQRNSYKWSPQLLSQILRGWTNCLFTTTGYFLLYIILLFLHSKTLLTFSPRGNLAGIILITLVPGCFHILGSLTRIAMPTINTVSIVRYDNYYPLLPPLLSNLDIFTQYGSVQVSHQHFFFHFRPPMVSEYYIALVSKIPTTPYSNKIWWCIYWMVPKYIGCMPVLI